jgi:peptidylprolyl isomerase
MKLLATAATISLALILAACSSGDDDDGAAEPPVAAAEPDDNAAAEGVVEPPADDAGAGEAPAADEAVGEAAPAAEDAPAVAAAEDPLENTLYLETACGRITIDMRPDLAPMHIAQIKTLARDNFYDGQVFHRVIDGFMAQTGDPTGTGRGGSPLPNIRAEFSDEPFVRGTVGMARTQQINTANSQFFITFDRADFLDGQYTVWGQVTDGMNCVDQIARGEPPAQPTVMISLRVAADVQ